MSITVKWNTLNRYRDDRGQECVECKNRIRPHSVAIRDIQNTNLKKWYHPECFIKAHQDKAIRILTFWRELCDENLSVRVRV